MSVEAAMIQYRQEAVALFEQTENQLRASTTKESVIQGNQVTFLVSGAGGTTAVTRGTNGYIPYGNPSNAQVTTTLVEKHGAKELTGFNIFASQGNQRSIMTQAAITDIQQDIDLTILSELANATQDFGTGTANLTTVIGAKVILGNNQVRTVQEDKMWAVVSPAFIGYLMQTPEFSHFDYVDVKPFSGPTVKARRWYGINWIESPLVTGVGTSSEICYLFHSDAIGYAANIGEEKTTMGYDDKQDISWARVTVYHAAKILQNNGIIKWTHDGSAFVAT
jgi:hypothetical protein